MSSARYRPLVRGPEPIPEDAVPLAGGQLWFSEVVRYWRGSDPERVRSIEISAEDLAMISRRREPVCGIDPGRPAIMGIINVTPDSFSDGGLHFGTDAALKRADELAEAGADILDIGGESTRPGATPLSPEAEIGRIVPVIEGIVGAGIRVPVSVDTRNAGVAEAAVRAGAEFINDVSAMTHDPDSLAAAAASGAAICLMHASGDPQTMQWNPSYVDVLLDVYDYLATRVEAAEKAGIPRSRIMVDPGIGFGKTTEHNLQLLRGISLFHGLGCQILLGASRKRFIGEIGGQPDVSLRFPGSVAVVLEGLRQGVQMVRVHDVEETRQAVALWSALNHGAAEEF